MKKMAAGRPDMLLENLIFDAMDSNSTEGVALSVSNIDYADTGYFGKIILDYIADRPALRPFYHRRPLIDSFSAQLDEKAAGSSDRETLVSALKSQYQKSGLRHPAIDLLSKPNSFTITTGHQVCLFTGPLYFIYKIVSAIKTCRMLSEKHPEQHFVPVFWMATEDHDFEEANHFYLPTGKLSWESGQGGAVGRMHPDGLDEVLNEMREQLGIGYHSGDLIRLFESAYLKQPTIADATRYLVHQIFGEFGVVSVDGDDPALKAIAAPMFKKELLEGISSKAMAATNEALSKHYNLQVHGREINLFYIDDQLRERIVRNADGSFEVVNTALKFTQSEILNLLDRHPEKFSPNVVLRGLYQEIILPNLAYIGGGGELAYWFQLKGVFASFGVVFPLLLLRNSALFIDHDSAESMAALSLSSSDLFSPVMEVENRLVSKNTDRVLNLDEAREKIEAAFLEVEKRLGATEASLERSVRSGFERTDRILKNLEKKLLKAERKKQDIILNRFHKLRAVLFPREGLQERNMNFAILYEALGPDFVEVLLQSFDPFDARFLLLQESEDAHRQVNAMDAT
jgi:bacillithiol biosynthesis cysteine-adding enzyme BshC